MFNPAWKTDDMFCEDAVKWTTDIGGCSITVEQYYQQRVRKDQHSIRILHDGEEVFKGLSPEDVNPFEYAIQKVREFNSKFMIW